MKWNYKVFCAPPPQSTSNVIVWNV
jgi:hypothetical protein